MHLGFAEVYDFASGKMAWQASGLPSEGHRDVDHAGSLARPAATCDIDDDLATIADKLRSEGVCVVVDGNGAVLGEVRREALELPPETVVADVLDPAPRTLQQCAPTRARRCVPAS